MSQSKHIALIGYLAIITIVMGFIALLLFLIALGSELSMPVITRDRPSANGLYEHSDQLGWKLKPNLNLYLQMHNGEVNRQEKFFSTDVNGLRATPANDPKLSTGLMLGDSFTQGFYLRDQESIPWQVAKLTNNNVINAGVGAYSTDQELLMLKKIITPAISWVVLQVCANDLPLNLENQSWGLYKPRYEVIGSRVNFEKLSSPEKPNSKANTSSSAVPESLCCGNNWQSTWQFSVEKFQKYLSLIFKPKQLASQIRQDYQWVFPSKGQYSYILPPSFYQNPRSLQREWDVTFQMIERMKSISESNGARFIATYIPEIAQMLNRDGLGEQHRPQAYFMRECARRNIECIDPTMPIQERATQAFIQDDGHLSAMGARIVAQQISKAISASPNMNPPTGPDDYLPPQISLGQVIQFGQGQMGNSFLINVAGYAKEGWGWTYPEGWGAWSEGSKAKITLPLPQNTANQKLVLELTLRALVNSSHPKQRVQIRVDGHPTLDTKLVKGDQNHLIIPLMNIAPHQEYVTIEFILPDAVSPKKLGLGNDERQLAIGITSAVFK